MAQPKSMYLRQVTVMLGLIILCMTQLGAGVFSLSCRYQLQEIQSTLDRNAGFISDYASVALTEGSSLTDKDFVNYIQSVVLLTDTTVLVCNTEGMVVCAAGTNWNQELLTSGEVSIPAWATNQLLSGRSYSGMTTFDGIFNTRCYVTSEVLSPLVRDQNTGELVSSNVPTGFLFVANDATSVMEFLQHTFQLFFITAIAVLLISFVGGELFTGNNMVMAFGAYDKQVSWKEAGKVWGVSYLGNFVGCAILALLFVWAGASGTADYFAGFIGNKLSVPLGQMFFRAVLCNFFVCLGVLCGMKLKSDAGRFLMIVMCISGFVVSGFEHCIANMGIFVTAYCLVPGLSLGAMVKSMVVVTLGNMVGGALLLAWPLRKMSADK